jgi:hypothetical protein
VVVGEAKLVLRGKELIREVFYEKTLDGKETFKNTVKASGHGRKGTVSRQPLEPKKAEAVKLAGVGGQTTPIHGRPKMLKPRG